jgi:hypothetical protein
MDYIVPGIVAAIFFMGMFSVMGGVLNMRHEERKMKIKAEIDAKAEAAINLDVHAELARVKDRLAVLERLATDEDRRLAGDISRLRDDARTRV